MHTGPAVNPHTPHAAAGPRVLPSGAGRVGHRPFRRGAGFLRRPARTGPALRRRLMLAADARDAAWCHGG